MSAYVWPEVFEPPLQTKIQHPRQKKNRILFNHVVTDLLRWFAVWFYWGGGGWIVDTVQFQLVFWLQPNSPLHRFCVSLGHWGSQSKAAHPQWTTGLSLGVLASAKNNNFKSQKALHTGLSSLDLIQSSKHPSGKYGQKHVKHRGLTETQGSRTPQPDHRAQRESEEQCVRTPDSVLQSIIQRQKNLVFLFQIKVRLASRENQSEWLRYKKGEFVLSALKTL